MKKENDRMKYERDNTEMTRRDLDNNNWHGAKKRETKTRQMTRQTLTPNSEETKGCADTTGRWANVGYKHQTILWITMQTTPMDGMDQCYWQLEESGT